MKVDLAGFEFDAAPGTFKMPYRGLSTPKWSAGRFASDACDFIVSIREDLRRAKLGLI